MDKEEEKNIYTVKYGDDKQNTEETGRRKDNFTEMILGTKQKNKGNNTEKILGRN